jgi:hypothetical protein
MKYGSKSAATFLWAILMPVGTLSAAEPAPAVPVKLNVPSVAQTHANPLRAALERKLRLVKQLLAESPTVQRIPQSTSVQAKRKLTDAQVLYAKAEAEATAGRVEVAIQLLDESLRQIASASSLVPDPVQQAMQERSRNTELREAIHTFQALHKSLLIRISARKLQSSTVTADIDRIGTMVDKADNLTAAGSHHEANVVLNGAYKSVVLTLNKILAAETIVYGLRFDSPAEEFRYELARNHSYEELIPIALAQLNTARETALLAERSVQHSRELRDSAQKQASVGNNIAALKTIQDATIHLQRSLRIAGVVVPQSQEISQ